jgi:hypothetical protein
MSEDLGPTVSVAGQNYQWIDRPAEVFGPRSAWSHHGLAITQDQSIVGFDQTAGRLILVDPDGVARHVEVPVRVAHGIALTLDRQGHESLWLADIGSASRLVDGVVIEDVATSGVVNVDLDGRVRHRLAAPRDPAYDDGAPYVPTSVAVDDPALGGDGSIWVSDGYGASLVIRYLADGTQALVLDGTTGDRRFDCPHSVFIDRRRSEPELLVADRANSRVQVFDLEGRYKRSFGEDFLNSPSVFATSGDRLIIGDLRARLIVVDADDRLIGHLGAGNHVWQEPGWPNVSDPAGVISPRFSAPGTFSSPHGLASAGNGSIFVAEWRISGRFVELRPTY